MFKKNNIYNCSKNGTDLWDDRIFETAFRMLKSLELDRAKYDAVSSVLLIDLLIEFTNFHSENLQRLPRSVDATKSKWWQ